MSLPQSAEYDEAIQNSRSTFIDSELRNATNDGPVFMGVPGGPVASGNFAIVYRFRSERRRIAVKCFTREKTDQQTRYQLIHEHLNALKLPWTIDFTFIKEGIRVKGKTYPIVKMEWIENAKTLLSHVTDAVNAKQPLDLVCDQFYRMTSDLRKHSIAHGDLQHANLIISDGKLLLIDYDGMCVPKTSGLKSEEDGLPDYQHPRRHGGTLQSSMDNFSTLIIWTSLHALSIDPTLWRRWVREDERLLFSRVDFTRPADSPLIRELLSFRDPRMSAAVEAIVKACAVTSLDQIPHLTEVVNDVESISGVPWWEPTFVGAPGVKTPKPVVEPQLLPSWIADLTQTTPQPPVNFKGRTPLLSTFSAISMASALIAAILGSGGGASATAAGTWLGATFSIYVIVLHITFLMRPEVAAKKEAEKCLSEAWIQEKIADRTLRLKSDPYLKSISENENKIKAAEGRILILEQNIAAIKKNIQEELQFFLKTQAEQRALTEKSEREAIGQSNSARANAKLSYEAQIRHLENAVNSAESRFTNQIQALLARSVQDRESRFSAKFEAFIQAEMAKVDIRRNCISGVSTHELNRCGFYTLADFLGHAYGGYLKHKNGKTFKIPGVGSARGHQLDNWRKKVIEDIRRKIPATDRDAINQAIDAETRMARQRFEAIRDQARTQASIDRAKAKAEYEKLVNDATRIENDAKQRTNSRLTGLSTEIEAYKSNLAREEVASTEPLTRELWALQSIVNPARHVVKTQRTKMQVETLDQSRAATKAHEKLQTAKQEVERYISITHSGLIRHAFS